ncbi:VWA domain-containing protein [Luteimicrobium sp. NPDC057192]|uniref:VWA domain-containing protein n=1 Tax=Luteimicrobium sp. NPDC057192 TaxID=3346042 RepID=UPI00363CA1F9
MLRKRVVALALFVLTVVVSGLATVAVANPLAAGARGAAAERSASGTLSATGARSFADLSSCLSSADHFLASVVVDESGSLQQTDPDNDRVGAIQAALSSLASLQTSAGTQLEVEADLGVFGSDYTQLVGWGPVNGDHGGALDRAVTQQIPSRNQAAYTDYRAALQGAEQSIDARAGELDGTTCSAILWFTDGRLDLDENGEGPKTQDARIQLCQQQGIVDGIRADGTTIIAMALFGGKSSGVTANDRARLKAIAEGRGGGQTCGTVPIPATSQGGAYLRADQPDALRASRSSSA